MVQVAPTVVAPSARPAEHCGVVGGGADVCGAPCAAPLSIAAWLVGTEESERGLRLAAPAGVRRVWGRRDRAESGDAGRLVVNYSPRGAPDPRRTPIRPDPSGPGARGRRASAANDRSAPLTLLGADRPRGTSRPTPRTGRHKRAGARRTPPAPYPRAIGSSKPPVCTPRASCSSSSKAAARNRSTFANLMSS